MCIYIYYRTSSNVIFSPYSVYSLQIVLGPRKRPNHVVGDVPGKRDHKAIRPHLSAY